MAIENTVSSEFVDCLECFQMPPIRYEKQECHKDSKKRLKNIYEGE